MAILLGAGTITGICFYTGHISQPEFVPYTFLQNFFLTKYNFTAVIISIFLFLLYTTIVFLFINVEFEKTQSTEIIYFAVFLIGCVLESVRICIPLLNLWDSSIYFLMFCTRLIIFARTIAPLALLISVVCSATEYRQYVEQNLLLMTIVSIILALMVPVNSTQLLPTGCYPYNYGLLLRIILISLTFISQIFKNVINKTKGIAMPLGMALLSIGYLMLLESYSYLFTGIGFTAIMTGTFIYLKDLHRQYLWT